MTRILYIARYRGATMHRKVILLSQQSGFSIRYIHPVSPASIDYRELPAAHTGAVLQDCPVEMMGSQDDPHRVMYRTLTFGMLRLKPDVVYAEEEPDSLAALHIALARQALAPRAKLVLYTWQNIQRPRRRIVSTVMSMSLHMSDAVVCANVEAAAILHAMGYAKPTPLIPAIGVDTTVYHRDAHTTQSAVFRVGYVGRFVAEKGIETLIKAIAHLSQSIDPVICNSTLVLLGSGPHRPALEALIRDMKLQQRVRFASPLPSEGVARMMAELDVLVLPSRTTPVWKEQFGRVLTEAMACRVPVIGSDSGAIPEVIGDAGLTFAEGDAAALASQLARLAESTALRADLAEKGYQRVMQNYTQEHIAQQTAQFIRRLVAV